MENTIAGVVFALMIIIAIAPVTLHRGTSLAEFDAEFKVA